MTELNTQGLPVWLVVFVCGAIFVAQAAPKIFGPLGKLIKELGDSRRRAAVEKDDADIAERNRQIAYLNERVKTLTEDHRVRDHLIYEHLGWDQQAMKQCPELGLAPPLWPEWDTHAPPEKGQETT